MAQKQPIIFDLDGTLIDTSDRHYDTYSEATKSFVGQPLDKNEYWELKRAKTSWPEILLKSGLKPNQLPDFLNVFIKKIEQPENLAKDELMPGCYETLDLLGKNHELYLISLRRSEQNLLEQLKQLGLNDKFTGILSGHTESEGYEKKLELIRQVPHFENAIIVGDTEADIVAGQKLNLKTVAVTSGIRSQQILETLKPDYLMKDIRELPTLAA